MSRTEDWSEYIPPEGQRAVELAGKWKHGWIPLDATAISSKMKGRTGGKRWWDKGGSGGNRKVVGAPKKGTRTRAQGLEGTVASAQIKHKGGPAIPGSARIHKPNESQTAMTRHKMTPSEAAGRGLSRKSGSFLTTKEVPGAKAQKRRFGFRNLSPDEVKDYNSLSGQNKHASGAKANVYMDARRKGQSHVQAMKTARSSSGFTDRAPDSKPPVRTAGGKSVDVTKRRLTGDGKAVRTLGDDAKTLAANYMEKHGIGASRKKLAELRALKTKDPRKKELADALEKKIIEVSNAAMYRNAEANRRGDQAIRNSIVGPGGSGKA